MPIPQRKQGQAEDTFISECIRELVGTDGYETDQASAICYQQLSVKLTADLSWRKQFIASKNPSTWIKK
jgi:hypothetical protein